MRTYTKLLSLESLAILKGLVGKQVNYLYSDAIEVHGPYVLARDFSVPIDACSHCVISSDWADTPESYLDYHEMSVARAAWPKGEAPASVAQLNGEAFQNPKIHLKYSSSALAGVIVLEERYVGRTEAVHYDAALVFVREDGYRFCIAPQQTIAGGLEFTESEGEVEAYLCALPVRVSVGETGR